GHVLGRARVHGRRIRFRRRGPRHAPHPDRALGCARRRPQGASRCRTAGSNPHLATLPPPRDRSRVPARRENRPPSLRSPPRDTRTGPLRQCAACPAAGATSRGNRRPPAPGSPLQRVLRRSWRRNRTADRSWSRRPASRRHVPPDRPPVRRRIPPPAMPPPAKRGRAKPPSAAFRPVFPCSPVSPPNHSIVFNRNHYYFHLLHTISAPRCHSNQKKTKNCGP